MDNFYRPIFVFLLAAILSLFFTKLMIKLAAKWHILDLPNISRKIHDKPIPLLGGVAIYLAFLLSIGFLWQTGNLFDSRINIGLVAWFLLASLILIVNGFFDDKYKLPPQISIIGPIISVAIVILAGLKITYVSNPAGGIFYMDNILAPGSFWSLAIPIFITFFWLMGMTYTTKLLDGIDGLASSIGLIASVIIFFVSLSWDVAGSTTSLLSAILAGAIFGFLIFNWHPAKIFLGEGGSTFIGFALGVLAIISGSKIATALLVMGFPALDILWVIVRRLKNKQPIYQGDNEHLHFRLMRAGLSQKQTVLFMGFISLCFGLVSILFTTKAKISALFVVMALMFLLSSWLNYKLKEKHEVK